MRSCLLALCPVLAGCQPLCLGQDDSCRMVSPCQALSFACAAPDLGVARLGAGDARPGGYHAIGADGDVLLQNDQVSVVISALGNQNYLDIRGGSIVDLATRGANNDAIAEILTTVGILPDDEADYRTLSIVDERPTRVAVQLRGFLRDRPWAPIATRYELRPCEPGVRVRTEVENDGPDPQLWALADGLYWSSHSVLPFTPGVDAGFAQPSFDLLTIDDAFVSTPFVAGSTHNGLDPGTSYAEVSCSGRALSGFQSSPVSSAGLPKAVVLPHQSQVYERFIAVAARPDVAGAADVAFGVRHQLWGETTATLRGRVPAGSGRERDASLLIVEKRDGKRIPTTQVVPAADGSFVAVIPGQGEFVAELHVLGRKVAEASTGPGSGDRDLGLIDARAPYEVTVGVVDDGGAALDAELYVVPADDASAGAAAGDLFGQFAGCSPWLGPPFGASPACNRVLVSRASGSVRFRLPPGRFDIYAYHGPFYSLARVGVDTDQLPVAPLRLQLTALPLRLPGTLSADLHVHGAASFDSGIPDADRVQSFAAADIEVIIATDHDVVGNYDQTLAALGLDDRITAVHGVETTGHVPYLAVPGDSFPRVIGHYNFWPLAYDPAQPRAGAPFDEFIEPGELFARVDPLFVADGIKQLNHPWAAAEFGRDLGFPRAIKLSLLQPLPVADDGTAQGVYARRHGAFGNGDHDTQEVMNGTPNEVFLSYRAYWFYLLDQGVFKTGTANSDSHSLTDDTVGAPRTIVTTATRAGRGFDTAELNRALKAGLCFGSNGPVIEASVVDGASEYAYGRAPIAPSPAATLRLRVSAAPWVVVDEVRLYVNGVLVQTISDVSNPADPFGTTGLVRYSGDLPLAALLPAGTRDAWLVVEAGAALPRFADLGGGIDNAKDGVPDTGDNNGDGVVDARDIAAGEDTGPLAPPRQPARDDPRYHFFQVVPGGAPTAFTNPFLFDRDGNGRFDGPGLAGSGLGGAP